MLMLFLVVVGVLHVFSVSATPEKTASSVPNSTTPTKTSIVPDDWWDGLAEKARRMRELRPTLADEIKYERDSRRLVEIKVTYDHGRNTPRKEKRNLPVIFMCSLLMASIGTLVVTHYMMTWYRRSLRQAEEASARGRSTAHSKHSVMQSADVQPGDSAPSSTIRVEGTVSSSVDASGQPSVEPSGKSKPTTSAVPTKTPRPGDEEESQMVTSLPVDNIDDDGYTKRSDESERGDSTLIQ